MSKRCLCCDQLLRPDGTCTTRCWVDVEKHPTWIHCNRTPTPEFTPSVLAGPIERFYRTVPNSTTR